MARSPLSAIVLILALGANARADVAELAGQILDDSLPAAQRQAIIEKHPDLAGDLVAAMTKGLAADDAKEEYRRIPWIWRVAIAAGKRNDGEPILELLDVSLPRADDRLRDWQSVVIGGGIINGISQAGPWPKERIEELLAGKEKLLKRWQAAIEAAAEMAENEKVPMGTRYDALRMIAMAPTPPRLAQLQKCLAKEANGELQMGAVSGLADVDSPQATKLLVESLPDLTEGNRALAIAGLLRSDERIEALLAAIDGGKLPAGWLSADQRKALLRLENAALRERATEVLRATDQDCITEGGYRVEYRDLDGVWHVAPDDETLWADEEIRWIPLIPAGVGNHVDSVHWLKRPHNEPQAGWSSFGAASAGTPAIADPGLGHWDIKFRAYYDVVYFFEG